MLKRIHVIFSGRVQGVGFRYTAESIAAQAGITGWVKNLRGGDVEVIAEGEEAALDDMLSRLEDQFSGYIVKKQVSRGPATGEYKDFGIEF
jgi:acylphosphatase